VLNFFIFGIGFIKNSFAENLVKGFDRILFITTGLLGIVLILMWFATDHSMTKNNFNLIWALPTNFIAAFYMKRSNHFVRKYFKVVSILCCLLLLCWAILPQQLNISLIAVVLLLAIRTYKIGFATKPS